MGMIEKDEEFVPPYTYTENKQVGINDAPSVISIPQEQPIEHRTVIAVDKDGKFLGKYVGVDIPEGAFPVEVDTDSAFRIWDFETQTWGEDNPPPLPRVSKKLILSQLRDDGVVTQTEAISFLARGELPPAFIKALNNVPSEKRDDEELSIIAETEFDINSLFVSGLAKSLKYKQPQIDRLFRLASQR